MSVYRGKGERPVPEDFDELINTMTRTEAAKFWRTHVRTVRRWMRERNACTRASVYELGIGRACADDYDEYEVVKASRTLLERMCATVLRGTPVAVALHEGRL